MNTLSHDASGWLYQQDYLTFLAVLGWVTTGLIAWGNAAGGVGVRSVPWKLFASFCLFAAIDGALDLARMVTPHISSPGFEAIFRLVGYGFLLEFSRRTAAELKWVRLSGWGPPALVAVAQGVLLLAPEAAPVPEVIIGSLAGVSAAVVIIATVGAGTRTLLATAAALLLLGPVEILRQQGGVTIDGLYGLFITGEGIETAICACVLAWVAGFGLWLHGVLRRRTFFAGRREMNSPLAAVVLPLVIVVTLVCGYSLVNWSSDRARSEVERAYLNLVGTAALAVEPAMVREAWRDGAVDVASDSAFRISRQVRGLLGASQFERAYVWNIAGGRVPPPREWLAGEDTSEPGIVKVGGDAISRLRGRQLLGPIGARGESVIVATAPIMETEATAAAAWLGLDISASEWLDAQARARLQTIALVGLFSSLIVFFLAHQMLREHEAELLVAKESAEAADRAKDEFLAVMSHEIRTPMQSVLGYGELMARTPLTAAQSGYLDAIRSQGRTLLRIVQDILDFSILRKSSYTLKTERVFLHHLVNSAYETLRPLAARKSVRFELTIANDVPEVVVGDAVRIEQILLNLAGNAVKFTDVGSVQIDVVLDGEERVGERVLQRVRFTISDTGMGIRQADVRRLFEPFTRLSYAEATPKEGAGLGLAIVKRLCQLMGGTIDLESEWGKGARFIVRIPFQPVEAEAAASAAETPSPLEATPPAATNLGVVLPLRVLVVEDNPFIRRLMVEYLRSIGYNPRALTNGLEAVENWQDADLLIMDLRMPGMDGVTAAARIRAASGKDNHPWIIGVSATLSEGEIQRAMLAGMNDFLGKPFFVQSLIEAIQASPMFARLKGEAAASAAASGDPGSNEPGDDASVGEMGTADGSLGDDDDAPVSEPPPGVMSWMPDLSNSGDTDIVKQAVAEIPGLLDEIGEALKAGNFEHAADRAHYLKNTIFALRMEPMVAPCRSVYERSQQGDVASAQQSLETLRAAFETWNADRLARGAGEPTLEA
ncbi:MAG: response regulator [Opitutaceae bacterium]|nr:response regulator [Opitutaceae bacterium]